MPETSPSLHATQITYPPELPVSQRREEIARAIRDNQVVVLAGETGSGKTTQLPKICLELGRTSIGHTQPRRIAARTIAERISEELGEEIGGIVGYQVRFADHVGPNTKIKLMTDGVLLNEINHDRMLQKYDTIIIDEAHERSLTIDFLIGYLKQLLPRRPELKLIITSATIDPESFSQHFGGAPIVEVSGRTFPVEIRYRPLVAEADTADDDDEAVPTDPLDAINAALDELAREGPGDVLVFLSGEAEIRDAEEAIRGRNLPGTEVLPLYGRLSSAEQHRVFARSAAPGTRRRIVLATNVAETSLTVPGIKYVIDSGTARISRYSVRSKIQRLPIEAISQASANQRSGRSGRLSDGIAIRLYSEQDFLGRPEYTEPEILRTNLAAVILQMISLGLGDIASFPFLQPPDSRGIKDGLDLLAELGAIRMGPVSSLRDGPGRARVETVTERPPQHTPQGTKDPLPEEGALAPVSKGASVDSGSLRDDPGGPPQRRFPEALPAERALRASRRESPASVSKGTTRNIAPAITKIGKRLARMPIDPRLARMVIESKRYGVTREVMAIVAALSIQDPRERPLEKRQQADAAHARFTDPTSDFLTVLNLWNYLKAKEKELSGNQFRRLCRVEYLNFLRCREWADVYRQLKRMAKPLGLTVGDASVNPVGIHRSLLAGLLSHIGIKDTTGNAKKQGDKKKQGDYIGARQMRFTIFPGSALAKKPPAEVMSAELVETSRLFARMNAAIDLGWAEPIAGDLAKHSYGEPHWEKSQGAAVAYERVTLYGVPIVARRRVQFARIDAAYARDLFIRNALVDGDWDLSKLDRRLWAFERANRRLRAELAELEERTRRRDILYDDEAVFDFYNRRIPADVTSQRSFESWWRKARADAPDLLTMTRETLAEAVPPPEAELAEASYPRTWRQGDQNFSLGYRFEPGADDDGVTVQVPLPLLAGLSPAGFDWQVPGLREELVIALIKSLPKAIRRSVVPAADWARKLLDQLPEHLEESDGIVRSSITEFLAAQIQNMTYTPVTAGDFDLDRVPAHLKTTFAVMNENGRQLAASKDLAALQHKLKTRVRESIANATARTPNSLERSGLTDWSFGELPKTLDTKRGQNLIRAYPALIDDGDSVAIRLMSTPEDQAREMRRGVRRMLLLATASPVSYVLDHLTPAEKLALAQSPYRSTAELFDDCLRASIDAILADNHASEVWNRAEFDRARDAVSAGIMDSLFRTVSLTAAALSAAKQAEKAIKAATNLALLGPLTDAREQLSTLVYPGFVSATGLARLTRLPVYLAGITHRLAALGDHLGRDRVWMTEVHTATERYLAAGGSLPPAAEAGERLVRARWLLEELRISLFAQHLGTAESVSLQRITRVLDAR